MADVSATIAQLRHLQTFCLRVSVCSFEHYQITSQLLEGANIELETLSLIFKAAWDEAIIDTICRFEGLVSLNIEDINVHIDEYDMSLSRLVRRLQKLEKIHVENLASINGVYDALTTAKQLKTAHFKVSVSFENAARIDDSLVAINSIRQERAIELSIDVIINDDLLSYELVSRAGIFELNSVIYETQCYLCPEKLIYPSFLFFNRKTKQRN